MKEDNFFKGIMFIWAVGLLLSLAMSALFCWGLVEAILWLRGQ